MEDTSKPPRHCEERSDEVIFFSQQLNLRLEIIRRKATIFATQKPAANAHCHPHQSMYNRPKQAGIVQHLSSFALCAKLTGFADSAYSVEQAQSQTRCIRYKICLKTNCKICKNFRNLVQKKRFAVAISSLSVNLAKRPSFLSGNL
ncbi:MAG: hypothetical protein IKK38_11200 [Spirochaetaceae bacterium]|nr:hypothetical protein [Spirochaetaceae bacterium]